MARIEYNWDECTSQCMTYTVAYPGYYDELHCVANDFYCMCRESVWVVQLLNHPDGPVPCVSASCAEPARRAWVASVSLECSLHGLDINTMIETQNMMYTYFDAQPASSSMSPESTNPTVASTSAFVPTISSMITATRPLTGQPGPSQASAESANTKSEGLSAPATGGLAAGVTVAGIAAIALIIWFVIRKRRKTAKTSDTPVAPSTQSDNSNETKDYHHQHSHEPSHDLSHDLSHELPEDGPPTVNSRAGNRMSDLDSIRPASELSSPPTDHDRWSTSNAMPTSPSSLQNVQGG